MAPAQGSASHTLPGFASAAGQARTYEIRFDAKRWGVGDFVAGIASLVLFISLFLPWYASGFFGAFSISAVSARSWMVLVLLVSLAITLYLVARAIWDFQLPFPHWSALLVAAAFDLLLTLICFFVVPVGASWSIGAILGLLAAVAAVVGAIVRRNEPEVLPVGASTGVQFGAQPNAAGGFRPNPGVDPSGAYQSTPTRVQQPISAQAPPMPPGPAASVFVPNPAGTAVAPGAPPAPPAWVSGVPQVAPAAAAKAPAGSVTCTSCGHPNPATNSFCNSCGRSIAG